jgi:hypothetical protein
MCSLQYAPLGKEPSACCLFIALYDSWGIARETRTLLPFAPLYISIRILSPIFYLSLYLQVMSS